MIRDKISKALINNDLESLNKYKIERKKIQQIEILNKEIEKMKITIQNIFERIEKVEKRL